MQGKLFRKTELPQILEPSSIYFIAPPSKPDFVELWVSNSTGTTAKRVITDSDVIALINSTVSPLEEELTSATITIDCGNSKTTFFITFNFGGAI